MKLIEIIILLYITSLILSCLFITHLKLTCIQLRTACIDDNVHVCSYSSYMYMYSTCIVHVHVYNYMYTVHAYNSTYMYICSTHTLL